jgi:hypothetical protein
MLYSNKGEILCPQKAQKVQKWKNWKKRKGCKKRKSDKKDPWVNVIKLK